MIPSLFAQQNPAEGNFSGLFEAGKMIIEVGIFAVFIYVVLRFLRATRGSGVIRGLALVVTTFVVAFFILAGPLQLTAWNGWSNSWRRPLCLAWWWCFTPRFDARSCTSVMRRSLVVSSDVMPRSCRACYVQSRD